MSYPATQTFWLEPTDQVAVGLRRYARTEGAGWTCADGYHNAFVFTGTDDAAWRDTEHGRVLAHRLATPRDDPRWPATCGCGSVFTGDDSWQDWQELLYRRTDTGEIVTTRRSDNVPGGPTPAPPGAMWNASWLPDTPAWRGPDGLALYVRLPDGHDWHVDGEATNCTRKGDRTHKCWVRHGDPRQANVTADKNGETCAAGAGSIQSGGYHGFLVNGVLSAG